MSVSPFTNSFDYEYQTYREIRRKYLAAEKERKQAAKMEARELAGQRSDGGILRRVFGSRKFKEARREDRIEKERTNDDDDEVTLVDVDGVSKVSS